MQVCGLLGGLSWASSMDYYRLMNQEVGRQLGGLHSSRVILNSLDLHDYATMAANSDFVGITKLIKDGSEMMQKGGAEFLVICSNTAHVAAKELEADTGSLPLLHIADCTAHAIKVFKFFPPFLCV